MRAVRRLLALALCGSAQALTACTQTSTSPALPAAYFGTPALQAGAARGDDWITFAHDYLRTGFESQRLGVTSKNIGSLRLRWKNKVDGPVQASPLAWDGSIYIVSSGYGGPATVYDFRASDGKLVWSAQIGGFVRATPSIDPANGLLVVGNSVNNAVGLPAPSFVFAIDTLSGKIAWQRRVGGMVRSSPVVAGGTVYVGTAGGDPPACLNGGVTGLDEATGRVRWSWHVNSHVSPLGGGSVWSTIAYDGAHLVFGTGNTCQAPITTANGAVSLDLNGKVAWSFVAVKPSTSDTDTGGGIVLTRGQARFINKNGTFYSLLAANGHEEWMRALNASSGFGGFASPSTDGFKTFVGAGLFAGSTAAARRDGIICPTGPAIRMRENAPGRYSELVAMNEQGGVIWRRQMVNRLIGYVAVVPGLVFAGLDNSLTALDSHTGASLWSYRSKGVFTASPAIVPSGLYAADDNGNVFAFTLPR